MPAVQTPYLIAALRERESAFLEQDEYTRLIEAETSQRALEVLVDTPYGQWLHAHPSSSNVLAALMAHLKATRDWLVDQLDKPAVGQFMAARYDGLNLAAALIQRRQGFNHPDQLSPLGAIDHSVIHSVIWNNLGWEYIPATWQFFLRHELSRLSAGQTSTWQATVLSHAQAVTITVMRELSFTPLMRKLTDLYEDQWHVDEILRRSPTLSAATEHTVWKSLTATDSANDVVRKLSHMGYSFFTEAMIVNVREGRDASHYDRAWDEALLERIRSHRFEAIGYDAILAYWKAKELEAKNIRILLLAKLNLVSADQLYDLQRPLYIHSL